MTVFGIAGTGIFKVFGITLPAFRIAGGLILWLVAMDMLRGERTTQESTEEIVEGQEKEDVALTPLAMPMLAGPGAISTVMVLAGQSHTIAGNIAVYGSVWLTAIICWLTLRAGDRLVSDHGTDGHSRDDANHGAAARRRRDAVRDHGSARGAQPVGVA